ncbi:MAG: 3'(2'),5'-bisphosphate nucleotidase CysQ [Desulfurobacteriaceae bacterium]
MNKELLDTAIKAALQAGKEILEIYRNGNFQVIEKADTSPLTLADRRAHQVIKELLSECSLPILSEEGKAISYQERKNWEIFWMVDPLDGTKEFLKRNGEFTVNIALVKGNRPVLGVVYAPALGEIYYASESTGSVKVHVKDDGTLGESKVLNPEDTAADRDYIVVVASRSHMSEETKVFIEKIFFEKEIKTVSKGSSLKLCLVAEGKADIYPRFAPTMEWDTAAGQAIVEFSGGKVLDTEWNPLRYNKENLLNPYFIALRKGYEL